MAQNIKKWIQRRKTIIKTIKRAIELLSKDWSSKESSTLLYSHPGSYNDALQTLSRCENLRRKRSYPALDHMGVTNIYIKN